MKILTLYITVCAIAVISVVVYTKIQKPVPCTTGSSGFVHIATQTLTVSIASSPWQQARGLGGCPLLAQKTGMYFLFSVPGPQTFWMKDMVIPIDIVWISQGRVVGITAHAPAPASGTPESALPLYKSPQAVDAVLEIGAGMAASYGLTQGSMVQFDS